MSKQLVGAATSPDPCGWRAGAGRVLANALLVLLAYEVVSMAAAAAQVILTGWTPPATPVEGVPLLVVVAVFLLVRRIYVLPGLLLVLVGLEYVARRAPHARVLTFIVALSPMATWELLFKSPGSFPSGQGALLGVTAVLFAVLARLPARFPGRSTDDHGAAQPPAGTGVAPR
jgi:membrane-associated phospholipid phosphatase